MNYEDIIKTMLTRGLIKKQKIDFPQIEALLCRAKKDLKVAMHNLEIDEEAAYNYAYLSMLRCGRSIVFLKGYRSVDGQQHKTIIELTGEILGRDFKDFIIKFDRMRRKRNQFTYDPLLPVSISEAKNALKTAEDFVDKTITWFKKENPQLQLDIN